MHRGVWKVAGQLSARAGWLCFQAHAAHIQPNAVHTQHIQRAHTVHIHYTPCIHIAHAAWGRAAERQIVPQLLLSETPLPGPGAAGGGGGQACGVGSRGRGDSAAGSGGDAAWRAAPAPLTRIVCSQRRWPPCTIATTCSQTAPTAWPRPRRASTWPRTTAHCRPRSPCPAPPEGQPPPRLRPGPRPRRPPPPRRPAAGRPPPPSPQGARGPPPAPPPQSPGSLSAGDLGSAL